MAVDIAKKLILVSVVLFKLDQTILALKLDWIILVGDFLSTKQ